MTHPRCKCGHIEADHQSNHAPFPHPRKYGLCMVDGCDCTEFRENTR